VFFDALYRAGKDPASVFCTVDVPRHATWGVTESKKRMGHRPSRDELAEYYERFAPVVYRRALYLVHGDADARDMVHEVFRRLIDGSGEAIHSSEPLRYFYRATTNACLNHLRSQRLRTTSSEPAPSGVPASVEPRSPDARLYLGDFLATLDDRMAQVAVMYFGDGMTHEEIAEVLGLSRKTIGRELDALRHRVEDTHE